MSNSTKNTKKPGTRSGLYTTELIHLTETNKAHRSDVDARYEEAVRVIKSQYPEVASMTEQQLIEYVNGQYLSQFFGPAECNHAIKNIESQRHLACKKLVTTLKENFTMDEIQRIVDAGLLSPYFSFGL